MATSGDSTINKVLQAPLLVEFGLKVPVVQESRLKSP